MVAESCFEWGLGHSDAVLESSSWFVETVAL